MNQNNDATIKCPNSEHVNDVKLVCFDESCKANRLQCIQCIRNGIHVSHSQHQQELPLLFEHIQRIEKECEDLITNLKIQMDQAQQQFNLLIGGIRSKYQKSKQQFLDLNSKQMNSFFSEIIQFKSFQQQIQILFQQSIKDFQDSTVTLLSDLKLYFNLQHFIQDYRKSIISELNYYQTLSQDNKKSDELYQKGYQLNIQDLNSIIYCNEKKFEEAIKVFDKSLTINSKHKLSLWGKAESLIYEAIIWADKALQVDPKHCNSLYCKGDSLRQKLMSISLRLLRIFKQAMEVIEQSLQINPSHFDSLFSKGACLNAKKKISDQIQDQYQFQEALIFYQKALKIDPNHLQTKARKDECVLALVKR